jgi:AraC family transcriptional regulator
MAGKIVTASGSARNRLEYERRINRVMDYVSRNLAEPLTLEKLADVAAFSPFHFHRVFTAMTGERVGDFIQRIRLERAARSLLRHPDREITEIALACGFGSSSSFAHAFKNHFGFSATQWRKDGAHNLEARRREQYSNLNQVNRKLEQAESAALGHNRVVEKPLNVSVTTLPDFHTAFMRNVGPYGAPQVPALWHRLLGWAGTRGLVTPDRVTIGISYDDPSVTPPEKCRYDACIVIPAGMNPEPYANVKDVRGGMYAVAEYVGTAGEIIEAWHRMFSSWLPSSGYQPDNRDCFELYRGNAYVDQAKGVFKCDICIPVRPL